MILVTIITDLTYMFGMIYTREFFKGIVIFKNEDFNIFYTKDHYKSFTKEN